MTTPTPPIEAMASLIESMACALFDFDHQNESFEKEAATLLVLEAQATIAKDASPRVGG